MVLVKTGWALALSLTILSFPAHSKSSEETTQTELGSVNGVVLDQQGKGIAGANVYAVLQEDMRRPVASGITDSTGNFILHDLPPAVIYIYSYKESDGYLHGFANFFAIPNDQSLVSARVEAGRTIHVSIKRGARAAYLKINVTDENAQYLSVSLTLRRDDQPGQFYRAAISKEENMMVPPVPFRLTIEADEGAYEIWRYGGVNWAGKDGLISLRSGQTLDLDVQLHRK